VADPGDENAARDRVGGPQPGADRADEVERARTPQTPALALAGVWLVVAVTVVVVIAAVALALYLV
jgi:hypothetical protein